jgi:hypothetical protein
MPVPHRALLLALSLLCAQAAPLFRLRHLASEHLSGSEALELKPLAQLYRLDLLFHRTVVTAACPGQTLDVFAGRSEASALAARAATTSRWLPSSAHDEASVSPLDTSWISFRARRGGPAPSHCKARVQAQFSAAAFAVSAAGALLVLHASHLAAQRQFRVSAGGFLMALTACLVLVLYLQRQLPTARLRALCSLLGLGCTALWSTGLRYVASNWQELLSAPLFLAYLALSALAGMLSTAYLESTTASPDALVESLALVLRMFGGLALLLGTQDPRLGGALLALLALAGPLRRAARAVGRAASPLVVRRRARAAAEGVTFSPDLSAAVSVGATGFCGAFRREEPPAEEAAAAGDCDLVQEGLIRNTATNKNLKIGGATYNKLVLAGASVDRARGTISPPPSGGRSPAGGGSPAEAAAPRRLSADFSPLAPARGRAAARRG